MGRSWCLEEDRWRPRVAALALIAAGTMGVSVTGVAAAHDLPDGRAYELVTPPDKNGGDAAVADQVTSDGDRVGFYSTAGFADPQANYMVTSYRAERTATGWQTAPMMPRVGAPNLGFTGGFVPVDFTNDITGGIMESQSAVAAEPGQTNVLAVEQDGGATWITAPTVPNVTPAYKLYAGRSVDGSHIVFESEQPFDARVPAGTRAVYEWVNGTVRLVSILPDGSLPSGTAVVGTGANGAGNGNSFIGSFPEPTAVSSDGRRIFFTDGTNLYVREDGATTREVSLSERAGSVGQPAPQAVQFAGAAVDGSRVFFISPDQLTDDATPGGGLYSYTLSGSPHLRFLSDATADPGGAQVEGVSQVSADGSTVYFVALGQLVAGQGTSGQSNLYVNDGSGVKYIATLGSDDIQDWSRSVGPGAGATHRTAMTTPGGRRFVFQSDQRLTSFDNRGYHEVYLYDDRDGSLQCASCGSDGHVAAGDASLLPDPIDSVTGQTPDHNPQFGQPRGITDDGSRVFFETKDDLVGADVNDVEDVYEYHDGTTSLISAGTGGYDSEISTNTPDGSDVFFTTRDSLVGQDIDGGAKDIYDARVGGGFPEPVRQTPCDADGCQPPGTPPPPAATPASGATGGRGNERVTRAPRLFVQPITKTGRANVGKTGKLTIVASVEAAGTVRASGTASYGDHRVYSLKSVKATLKKAGTVHLHLRVPTAVLRQVRRHHRASLSITVTYNKAIRPAHVALTLR